jgi:hypothetical protein
MEERLAPDAEAGVGRSSDDHVPEVSITATAVSSGGPYGLSVPTPPQVVVDGHAAPARPVSIQPEGPGDDAVQGAGPDSAAGYQ